MTSLKFPLGSVKCPVCKGKGSILIKGYDPKKKKDPISNMRFTESCRVCGMKGYLDWTEYAMNPPPKNLPTTYRKVKCDRCNYVWVLPPGLTELARFYKSPRRCLNCNGKLTPLKTSKKSHSVSK
jgi:RNase P subunit RPR2